MTRPRGVVTYESLATEYPATIQRILDSLERGDVDVPPPHLQRQSAELMDDWAERYRGSLTAPR